MASTITVFAADELLQEEESEYESYFESESDQSDDASSSDEESQPHEGETQNLTILRSNKILCFCS